MKINIALPFSHIVHPWIPLCTVSNPSFIIALRKYRIYFSQGTLYVHRFRLHHFPILVAYYFLSKGPGRKHIQGAPRKGTGGGSTIKFDKRTRRNAEAIYRYVLCVPPKRKSHR